MEIADSTTETEMQRIIRELFDNQAGCPDAPTAAKIDGLR
jgi:hypothetical protein